MQFTLHWLGNDTSPTIAYFLSFRLEGAKQPTKINITTKSSQRYLMTVYILILYIYLVEQPSIWEKYQTIIMIITLILVIIVTLSLLLCFFPDHLQDTIGKGNQMQGIIYNVIPCFVNVFWVLLDYPKCIN